MWGIIIALALATSMVALDLSVANVSIPYITGDIGISPHQGIYIITFYFIGEALSLPLSGWLSKRVGKYRLLLLSILLFVIASAGCGIAPNLEILATFRFIQGFVSGPLIPLSQAFLAQSIPKEKAHLGTALWGAVFMSAWAFAPLLGGWLTTNYGWPWIFYINIPIGFISLFILFPRRKQYETPIETVPIDWLGIVLLAVGVICWEFVLDQGQQWDWWRSSHICLLSAIAIVAFALMASWVLDHPAPSLELRFFKKTTFVIATCVMLFSIVIDSACLILIPLRVQLYAQYNAYWAGLTLLPFGLAALIFGSCQSLFVEKLGLLGTIALGCLLAIGSCLYQVYALNTDLSVHYLWPSRFLLGGGIILNFISCGALCIREIPPAEVPSALGIFHFVRALFGALGNTVFMTLWQRRLIHHHAYLAESITQPKIDSLSPLNGGSQSWALASLNQVVDAQAAVLSLRDCFLVMTLILIVGILILPLARAKKEAALSTSGSPHAE